jgi:hypothetical protein
VTLVEHLFTASNQISEQVVTYHLIATKYETNPAKRRKILEDRNSDTEVKLFGRLVDVA